MPTAIFVHLGHLAPDALPLQTPPRAKAALDILVSTYAAETPINVRVNLPNPADAHRHAQDAFPGEPANG